MNIDVREYLRINPISAHELSISDAGDDGFMYFYDEFGENKYHVALQTTMFDRLCKVIFRDMIVGTGDDTRLAYESLEPISWSGAIHLTDDQFVKYQRRKTYIKFKNQFELDLSQFETMVQNKLDYLRNKGVLDYAGSVEIMSTLSELYSDFKFALNQIWCYETGQDPGEGKDRVELTVPFKHKHDDTLAETMSESLSANRGGSYSIGEFRIGDKQKVSYSSFTGSIDGKTLKILEPDQNGILTYPLQGYNVLFWRYPDRTHNNIPPSYNVYVRYKDTASSRFINKDFVEPPELDSVVENLIPVEAQYYSNFVTELEEYTREYLSDHDYLLRLTHNEDGTVELKKQTVQHLLDIFSLDTSEKLGVRDKTGNFIPMSEIVNVFLDQELIPIKEFNAWYVKIVDRFKKIEDVLNEIRLLLISVPLKTYVGRIIISTTDDIETKVIKHYGGKRWRRIVNFLRGVDRTDASIGQKFGEELVCLRESNVPNHTHDETVKTNVLEENKWMCNESSGYESRLVNYPSTGDNVKVVNGVKNDLIEYQISPLKYENRNDVTLPHDNMPPYKEVYIWECTEVDRYVPELPEESDKYSIQYELYELGTLPSSAWEYYSKSSKLPYVPPQLSNVNGYQFIGWNPKSIQPGESGNKVFYANWKPLEYRIVFIFNDGTPNRLSYVLQYGVNLGRLPTPIRDGYSLAGWYTGETSGFKIEDGEIVTKDAVYYAHWKLNTYEISYDMDGLGEEPDGLKKSYRITDPDYTPIPAQNFEGWNFIEWQPNSIPSGSYGNKVFKASWDVRKCTVKFMDGTQEIKTDIIPYGDDIGGLPEIEKPGHTFIGWYIGDEKIERNRIVKQDLVIEAQWDVNQYFAFFDGNGGTPELQNKVVTFNTQIGELPAALKTGYDLTGWWNEETNEQITNSTIFDFANDFTFHARWKIKSYTVTFDGNNGTPEIQTKNIEYGEHLLELPQVSRAGHTFIGWYTEKDGGNRVTESTTIIEDSTFYARWKENSITVTFNSND